MIDLKKQNIADTDIIKNSIEEITEYILNTDKQTIISTLSMPLLGDLRKNPDYYNALRTSEIILPDGIGIILLSKLKYGKNSIKKRIAGPDFFFFFNRTASEKKLKYFFLGSTEKVLDRIKERLLKEYPNIKITGMISPPFGEWNKNTNDEIIDKINSSQSDVLWVAMTAPKQEIWVYKNKNRLNVKVIASIGAAFDFFAEAKKRAPMFYQKLGIEWFYRTLQEPVRMGKRYLKGFPAFMSCFLKCLKKRVKK